jgi:hypothetical protein
MRESELSGVTPHTADERMYCLLQDDSLITRVSVATHQLLEPLASGEDAASVDLVMQSTYAMWETLGSDISSYPHESLKSPYFFIAKSSTSKICRISITSPSSAGQRSAHFTTSSFDLASISQ